MKLLLTDLSGNKLVVMSEEISHIYEGTTENQVTKFANELAEGKKPEIEKHSIIVMKNGHVLECNMEIDFICNML